MHRAVRFADDIEPLVRFIEETDGSRILEATLDKLREGVSVKTMLTASALAVTRSSDLPPGHHGGPLHPLVGIHALHHTVDRVTGEQRFLPILQHVALANKHINHPNMGPYILAEAEPLDSGGVEATKKAFLACVDRGLYNGADRHFLWLWDHVPHGEALDLLLTVAIPKNTLDDHYFIFPMFTWRALDWLGREHTKFLMRPAVRYVSRFPTPPPLKDIEPLLDEYELLKRPLGFYTSPEETPEIGELGEAITRCDAYAEIPKMLARALAGGPVARGHRRGPVDRRRRPVHALAHRQSDGRASAHRGEPAPVSPEGGGREPAQQALGAVDLAHRPRGALDPEPHGAAAAARSGGGGRAAPSEPGGAAGRARGERLHPAGDRLVEGHQSRPDARGARGEEHRESRPAVRRPSGTIRTR